MKHIKDSVLSSLNEARGELPVAGEVAYDYFDEAWTILDFCQVKDKRKLREILKMDTGAFQDGLDDGTIADDDYAVAAAMVDDPRDMAVFVWGPDGLHYK